MSKRADERYTHGRAARRRRKTRRKYTMYYILTAVMMLSIAAVLSLTVFFNITEITVSGDSRYSDEDIIEAAGVDIGDNLFRISVGDIKRQIIMEFPYIDEVKVRRVLPEGLHYKVSECQPAAVIERGDEYLLLSPKGRILEKLSNLPEESPRVVGIDAAKLKIGGYLPNKEKERLSLLLSMLDIMKTNQFEGVTVINLEDLMNIHLLYQGRVDIQLGSSVDLDYKLRAAKSIADISVEKQTVGIIDVSNREAMRFREMNIYADGQWNFPEEMLEDYKRQLPKRKPNQDYAFPDAAQ